MTKTKAVKKRAARKNSKKEIQQYVVLDLYDGNCRNVSGPFKNAEEAHNYAVGSQRVMKLSRVVDFSKLCGAGCSPSLR